jgi:hypothetical protein
MSGNIRIKQFPELVAIRTQENARSDLDVYSKAESNALAPIVDLSAYTLLSTTASISGGLDSRLDVAEADIVSLESTTANISADVYNFDVALSNKIQEDCMQSAGISGSGGSVTGYLNITINEVAYKVALIP